jgi:hypothetical protein
VHPRRDRPTVSKLPREPVRASRTPLRRVKLPVTAALCAGRPQPAGIWPPGAVDLRPETDNGWLRLRPRHRVPLPARTFLRVDGLDPNWKGRGRSRWRRGRALSRLPGWCRYRRRGRGLPRCATCRLGPCSDRRGIVRSDRRGNEGSGSTPHSHIRSSRVFRVPQTYSDRCLDRRPLPTSRRLHLANDR